MNHVLTVDICTISAAAVPKPPGLALELRALAIEAFNESGVSKVSKVVCLIKL